MKENKPIKSIRIFHICDHSSLIYRFPSTDIVLFSYIMELQNSVCPLCALYENSIECGISTENECGLITLSTLEYLVKYHDINNEAKQ